MTVNGEDSESYRDQDFVYVMNGGCMMPERNIRFRRWKEERVLPAVVEMYYRGNAVRQTVKYLEKAVHHFIRLEPVWYRMREPAQLIISIIAGENNFHLQSIRYNKL